MRFVKHALAVNSCYHRSNGRAISAQAMAPKRATKSHDTLKKQAEQAVQKHCSKTSAVLDCRLL